MVRLNRSADSIFTRVAQCHCITLLFVHFRDAAKHHKAMEVLAILLSHNF